MPSDTHARYRHFRSDNDGANGVTFGIKYSTILNICSLVDIYIYTYIYIYIYIYISMLKHMSCCEKRKI